MNYMFFDWNVVKFGTLKVGMFTIASLAINSLILIDNMFGSIPQKAVILIIFFEIVKCANKILISQCVYY